MLLLQYSFTGDVLRKSWRKQMDTIEKRIEEILMDEDDSIDYKNEKHLIDDRLLDSFGIISLISDLEEEFDVKINAVDMVPENFNSIEGMASMIKKLQDN
jgi:acyl carrier protein